MKSIVVWSTLFLCLAVWMPETQARPVECPAMLPAGIVIRAFPDEKLTAGTTAGPTILTVTSDVRFFPGRPPLLARGSKILGNIVESRQAGRFHGRARFRIALTSILTSDFCEYPIDAKVVEAGSNKVADEVIVGRGHAKRDVFALLFPPTTIYQLLRLPARGPQLVVDNETPLTIKLMQPLSLGQASMAVSGGDQVGALRTRIEERESTPVVSVSCPAAKPQSPARVIVQRASVVRPLRNLTTYHVSVFLDRRPIAILPPCYGPSMISTPTAEFRLEASASLPTQGGQRQIGVRIVPNTDQTGWDVVPEPGEAVALRAN